MATRASRATGGLRLYGRGDCSLCDVLARQLAGLAVDFEKVDIDRDAQLRARYGTRIPVLARADGAVLAEGRVADAVLRARLGLE